MTGKHRRFNRRYRVPNGRYKMAAALIAREKFSGKSVDKKFLDALMTGWRLEVEPRGCLERANGTRGDRLTLTRAV